MSNVARGKVVYPNAFSLSLEVGSEPCGSLLSLKNR